MDSLSKALQSTGPGTPIRLPNAPGKRRRHVRHDAEKILTSIPGISSDKIHIHFYSARLLRDDEEVYCDIQKYVRNGQCHKYGMEIINIIKIHRDGDRGFIYHPVYKAKMRMMLWHGTKEQFVAPILFNGFVPPQAKKQMFGTGIYFADRASKSANYCGNTGPGDTAYLFLCEVVLGTWYACKNAHPEYTRAPSFTKRSGEKIECDSVACHGQNVPDRNGQKELENGSFLPFGKTVQNPKFPNSILIHNEFIVFNPDQIKIRFIVKIKFTNAPV